MLADCFTCLVSVLIVRSGPHEQWQGADGSPPATSVEQTDTQRSDGQHSVLTHMARARACVRVCVCEFVTHLCCFRLSCRLNVLPQVSQVKVTSSLCVLSWIMRLYGLVKRRWQYLQMNSHLALILRRNSRRSSASIGIMANIAEGWNGGRSAGTRENDVSGAFSAAHQISACTVKGKLSPLRACGSRTWVSTPRRTDPRLPVPITLPLVLQRGKSEPRGECSHETCRLGSA